MPEDMARLQITQSYMPLDSWDKQTVVGWLRQIADEIEKGEQFSTSIFVLGPKRRAKL